MSAGTPESGEITRIPSGGRGGPPGPAPGESAAMMLPTPNPKSKTVIRIMAGTIWLRRIITIDPGDLPPGPYFTRDPAGGEVVAEAGAELLGGIVRSLYWLVALSRVDQVGGVSIFYLLPPQVVISLISDCLASLFVFEINRIPGML